MSANELLKSELWHNGPQYLQLPPDQWPTIDCLDNASANEELVKRPQEIIHTLQVRRHIRKQRKTSLNLNDLVGKQDFYEQ